MIDDQKKEAVWQKMPLVVGKDPALFRLDACGALIKWDEYGDRQSDYGWEVDHVVPKALLQKLGVPEDEFDDVENLRPIHWKNNDSKAADYPEYQAKVKFEGESNIEREAVYEVNKNLQQILHNKYSKYGL